MQSVASLSVRTGARRFRDEQGYRLLGKGYWTAAHSDARMPQSDSPEPAERRSPGGGGSWELTSLEDGR